jgi:hypothetical protein
MLTLTCSVVAYYFVLIGIRVIAVTSAVVTETVAHT